jgi:hypothetical protein
MTWKLDCIAAQAALKHLRRPDSFRLFLSRFGWREKTIISFATTILLATSTLAQMPVPYALSLSLFNDARVPPSIVNSAEETASRIFAQSGIELHWLPCGREEESVEEQRACIQTYFPEHLHVHIVNSNPHLNGSVFGISYFSADGIGSQADVFYTKIASFHDVSSVEPGTLLGHAMAHELGHLLLGSNSHSLTGLMCANWRTKDLIHMEQGGLLFSEEQSLKMKAKLSTFAMQKDTGFHAVPSGGELP